MYRTGDLADCYLDDYDFFATRAMNATPAEEDALQVRYLKMTYELPADEEAAVAHMSAEGLRAILARSKGKSFASMSPHEYALRFAAKMALEEVQS